MLDKFLRFAETYLNEPKLEDIGIGPYEFWGFPGNDKKLVATMEPSNGTFTAEATYQQAITFANQIDEAIENNGDSIIYRHEMELNSKEIFANLILIDLHWAKNQVTVNFAWEEA